MVPANKRVLISKKKFEGWAVRGCFCMAPRLRMIIRGPSWEIDKETVETVSDFIFGAPKSLQTVTAAMKLKDAHSLEEKLRPT